MPTIIPRECLRITPETVPGTYASGNTPYLIRLTRDNAFTGIPEPMRYVIRDAGSSNRAAQTGYGQVGTKCSLVTPWYFSQSAALITSAIATGSGPLLLPSVTIDHMTMMEDGSNTKIYTRYLGCYIRRLAISMNNTAASIYAMLNIDFDFLAVANITVTDFPNQALASYNTDLPVIFTMSAGGVTIHAAARTSYKAFNLTIENILDVIYDESAYPQAIKWCGSNASWGADFRFKALTDRNDFQAVTAIATKLVVGDGTNVGTFDLQGKNYFTGVGDQLSLNGAHYQSLSGETYLDYATGLQMSYVQTP